MTRWLRALLACALLVGMAGAAEAVTRGGTLTYARYADSLFLDPVLNDANVDIWILTNLYDTLLQPTSDGKDVQPGLATEYKMSDDAKSLTLKLRSGIKFSDGSPITVNDVKWSLDRARNPKNGIWNFTLASVDSIETQGEDTVVLKLKNPDPTLVAALATFNAAILPQKQFEATAGATDEEKAKAFAEKPVGSGAFMFDRWQRGTELVIKRNPHYWQMGEDGKPLPYLDEVRFPVIPDDATRILKLQAGEVDGAELIPYARVAELKGDANINMELFPSTKVQFITVNVRPTLKNGEKNVLADPKVRQALNYAIDKNAMAQIVTFGIGTPLVSFMSSATPLVDNHGEIYAYDVEKAKALLKEAGIAEGTEVTSIGLAGSADETAILSTIQQMWSAVGVKLNIEQLDNATRTARYRDGDFQMRVSLWTDDIADPSEITSYFAYFPNIESLHSGWQDKSVDELFLKSQQEMDKEKRADMYKTIQQKYVESAPIMFLYESPYPVALRKQVKGFNQIPLGNNIFSSAYVEK
ncbi:MAG: peptide ABC transporter substrate-binding protein [Rhodospirillum sp.]|jgi:peptide/nickel transport system substrate-binding protein|nr:peptide ABC transporter substrate-binding protein [Rhodospirillum sp.]